MSIAGSAGPPGVRTRNPGALGGVPCSSCILTSLDRIGGVKLVYGFCFFSQAIMQCAGGWRGERGMAVFRRTCSAPAFPPSSLEDEPDRVPGSSVCILISLCNSMCRLCMWSTGQLPIRRPPLPECRRGDISADRVRSSCIYEFP